LERYLIDTDPGIDDAVAITLAVAGGHAVGAICTVAGNVAEEQTATNAARVLAALGAEVPICRGSPLPLLRAPLDAQGHHGADGLGGALPGARPPAPGLPAYRRLLDFDGTVVALGPLTNVALAVLCDRTWPRRVRRLVVMGGELRVGGNVTAAAEFNFHCDPEAAAIVLAAGFPRLDLVPLDCRQELALGPEEWERLTALPGRTAGVVRRLVAFWSDRIRSGWRPALYDAVAWMAAIHPELFRWEDVRLEVDTAGGAAYGACLADRRPAAPPPNARAYAGADPGAYWDAFFAVLAAAP
jgi:inosine-uridine nucleoside N-ribohydrolase